MDLTSFLVYSLIEQLESLKGNNEYENSIIQKCIDKIKDNIE